MELLPMNLNISSQIPLHNLPKYIFVFCLEIMFGLTIYIFWKLQKLSGLGPLSHQNKRVCVQQKKLD